MRLHHHHRARLSQLHRHVRPLGRSSPTAGEAELLPPLASEEQLLRQMTAPTAAAAAVARGCGDSPILLLGVSGKMGPSLAVLLKRAGAKRVIGVARFSDAAQREFLESHGVETIAVDLLADGALAGLPDARHVFLLAGFKFGASSEENAGLTWAMNALLPAEVVRRFPTSSIVYVSSGNVYPFTPVVGGGGGSSEHDPTGPVGEYAQSRLGGERLAIHVATQQRTALCVVRLFYATECRYGIVHDLAQKVLSGEPIPLAMGHVNQIWQGDANEMIVRCLPLCETSDGRPRVLNLTGTDVLSVRALATELGRALGGKVPVFEGEEASTALLGNTVEMVRRLGAPPTSMAQVVAWVAAWVAAGGRSLNKPTKFESREGEF
jgi:nucleoside-diphosphate-sugar epimerase